MSGDPTYEARLALHEAAGAARDRAMTSFEEHLGDAMIHLAQVVDHLNSKLDAVLAAQRGTGGDPS